MMSVMVAATYAQTPSGDSATQASTSKKKSAKKLKKKRGASSGSKTKGAAASSSADPKNSNVIKADPIDPTAGVKIQIPSHLRDKGGKIRIRNLTTGREAILTIDDEEFISSDVVKTLTDGSTKLLVPEFSVLTSIKRSGRINAPSDPSVGMAFTKEKFLYSQPVWKPVPFALQKLPGGGTKIYIDTKQSTFLLSPEAAAARRDLKEDVGIRKLFDVGFRALKAHKFDVSLESFRRLLAKKDVLTEVQLRQASLGHGISSFHQKGCQAIEADFKIADQDPKNFDDVSYYRALCFVEAKRFDDAGGLFRDLARRQSPVYAEQARFYSGVVSENQEKYDEAESAYLDTIDFANDQRIVGLAKERVEIVKRLKAERNYENKWFALSMSAGTGYDTNVVSLPASLSPADYNLTNVKSISYLGLGSFDIKPKFSRGVDNHLRYTLLALHYQDAAISAASDVQSHDGAFAMDFGMGPTDGVGFTADYNSVFLGPVKTSHEYLVTTSGEVHWNSMEGEPAAPTGDTVWSFKTSLVRPRVAAPTAATNSRANAYLLSWRYTSRANLPSVMGPGFDLEYRPSSGVDNSYVSPTLSGNWSHPFGSEKSGLYLSHEGVLQDTYYYQHTTVKRNDYILKYTGSLSMVWWQKVEAKLQFIGTMSFSNVTTYTFKKVQLNFLVSTSF